MTDQEIHSLRSKCRSLEKETRQLEIAKSRLESKLLAVQQSLDREQCTTKTLVGKRANDLLNLQRHYIDKFETATKLLKIRLQWELNQALQRQKEQLKMNFRSDLFMLTNKNTQLATILSYTQQQLQQVDRCTEKRRVEKQLYKDDAYNKRLDNLRKEFERQTTQLLKELKERERTIERLQRSISTLPSKDTAGFSSNEGSHLEQIASEKSGGPVRNKNHRGIRVSKGPYTTSHNTTKKKRRQKCTEEIGEKMKELDIVHHSLESHHQPFYSLPSHHQTYHQYYNNNHHHQFYQQQQYGQCGGSGLETLPEADSEEESLTTTKEDVFPSGSISTGSPSSQISSVDFSFQNACKIQEGKSLEDFTIEDECKHETHKVSLLESIIKQLRDELRECKDQNELLEFRLLEIEEVNSNGRQHAAIEGADGESEDSNAISCLSLPQVINNGAEYEGTNGHSTVTESRSSCGSDCSESLSLQESGIFDSQGSDESTTGNGGGGRNSISRELASLTFQIEELLRRYNEGDDDSKERNSLNESHELGLPKRKTSHDLASELNSCRQKIQEFERRLSQMNDINYLRSLEEKVNFLVRENKRVEEERAEIEEAENDNRHLCQRLEEKMTQLQKKKLSLQNKLALEKRQIEQLRFQIIEMQEREGDLCSKITKLEGLLQNYEQRNFELEETCIEMKCSVQFVIHSMPIFSLCYFWYLLRRFNNIQPMTFFNFFMEPRHTTKYTKGYQVKALPWQNGILSFGNNGSVISNSVSLLSPRKHKLLEIPGVEPRLKKSKSLKGKPFCVYGDDNECNENNNFTGSLGMASDSHVEVVVGERMRMTNAGSQTGEELWKIFMEGMVLRQRAEWDRVEKSLRKKIEVLECDIDLCQESFDKERNELIEMYETKLGEKEIELKEIRHCQNEKRELQEKWNCLIQELEQFALYLGKNLNGKTEGVSQLVHCGQIPFNSPMSIDAEMSDSSCLASNTTTLATNLRSEFIHTLTSSSNNESQFESLSNKSGDTDKKDSEMIEKAELISLLQSSLKSHLGRFEIREQQLLGEIDRLVTEIKVNAEKDAEAESNMISHLTEENHRLETLFKDHDKVWADFKRLQNEHEKLKSELSDTMALRKRLEESQKSETELRERLEEEERTESALKTRLAQMERKEQKGLEKIHQLRDEIQFLRNKCCQLQDDIDMRVAKENKYKNEIQNLASRLRESTLELEEKESQLESNESALQSQIAKLKFELQELHQSYTDTECCNGMLREEVSYLEKTVEEAVSKAVESENAITALSHELKQKDVLIEELQTQLRQLKMTDSVSLSPVTPHELSDFNRNDGGLHGIVRAVEEVVNIIQRCSHCESLGAKLMGTVERLIPLIQILKSSHVTDFHFATEPEVSLSRCESDEVLISPMACMSMGEDSATSTANTSSVPLKSSEQTLEEDEVLIGRLQETMTRLALQITKLEESLNIRQKEIKESHLTETALWKYRCEEKNSLIQLLGRRIAHLSITDIQGYFINGILKEIEKVGKEYRKRLRSSTQMLRGYSGKLPTNLDDFSCDSLRLFLIAERRRIMELFESTSDETLGESDNQNSDYLKESDSRIDFRVLKRIGDDALLVCWTMPENLAGQRNVNGYEIAVNGSTYLRIPQPNRHKAVLFGLNLDQPLKLTFRCPGDLTLEETITFIS